MNSFAIIAFYELLSPVEQVIFHVLHGIYFKYHQGCFVMYVYYLMTVYIEGDFHKMCIV